MGISSIVSLKGWINAEALKAGGFIVYKCTLSMASLDTVKKKLKMGIRLFVTLLSKHFYSYYKYIIKI